MGSRAGDAHLVAGKYKLERTLGEGGMGVVYAAEHVDLQKRVAIKIMREELISQVQLVERMVAEARTVARLRSEHVAQVIDVGRLKGGAPFIVMEYLDGCDLNTKLLESGQLPVELTVEYVMQACEAVAEAHAAGIVHRDIKPENLFLSTRTDGEPIIKVLDFGISRSTQSGERDPADSLIAGSPDYMSPEAMRGETRVAPATDIWSLGAVLYEMLTGRRPFESATVTETCARVIASDPMAPSVFLPSIPPGLECVVLRCLRKEPSERFATVVDLAAALAPFGPEGAVEQAQRVARVASGGRWNPRTTSTPKRMSFPSFSDVPNSTAAVVAEPAVPSIVAVEISGRRKWQTAALVLAGAALATFAIMARARPSAPPVRAQVAAVAAPATLPSVTASALSTALPSSQPARAVATATSAPTTKALALPRARPVISAPTPAASAPIYEDEPPHVPPSAEAPPSASETQPSATAPKVANSAPPDAWSPDSFGGRK